jgi:hypothetical protein
VESEEGCTCEGRKFFVLVVGCSGMNHVCTWVAVKVKLTYVRGLVGESYVHGLQWAQSRMYAGCSKVNHVHPYKFSGQEQVCTG